MVLFASGRILQLSGFNMYICDITIKDRKKIHLTRSELTFVLESLALDFIRFYVYITKSVSIDICYSKQKIIISNVAPKLES